MTQPSSPEFYEDFLDLHFHLDLFYLSSTIHLLWTQILTPISWVMLIEKSKLVSETQSRCGFPKAVACTRTKHRQYRVSWLLAAVASGFSCGTCSETLSDAFSWKSSAWSKIVVESVGCNLLKRTESSGIVATKSGVMKDSAESSMKAPCDFFEMFDLLWYLDRHWLCQV